MWSVGCIFAEFMSKKPLLPGKSEHEQLDMIFKLLGTPTEEVWPGWTHLPGAKLIYKRHPASSLRYALGLGTTPFGDAPFVSEAGMSLLRGLLTLDPAQRLNAVDALSHKWFQESPPPTDPRLMPSFPSSHARIAAVKTPDYVKAQGHVEADEAS
jgi:cell division cycle 2-like protein